MPIARFLSRPPSRQPSPAQDRLGELATLEFPNPLADLDGSGSRLPSHNTAPRKGQGDGELPVIGVGSEDLLNDNLGLHAFVLDLSSVKPPAPNERHYVGRGSLGEAHKTRIVG